MKHEKKILKLLLFKNLLKIKINILSNKIRYKVNKLKYIKNF